MSDIRLVTLSDGAERGGVRVLELRSGGGLESLKLFRGPWI